MKINGKRETIIDNDKLFPYRIGYSLGTVYDVNPDTKISYKLYNFGYCPSMQKFYFNFHVHLPKEIIEYFESSPMTPKKKQEMQEIGIYQKDDVDSLLMYYNETKAQNEIAKEKTLNLRRTLTETKKR